MNCQGCGNKHIAAIPVRVIRKLDKGDVYSILREHDLVTKFEEELAEALKACPDLDTGSFTIGFLAGAKISVIQDTHMIRDMYREIIRENDKDCNDISFIELEDYNTSVKEVKK